MIQVGARSLPVHHVSVRLPWHDTGWTGTVCRAPEQNTCCMILNRIRKSRDDTAEAQVAGRPWAALPVSSRPPCREERAGAMSPAPDVLRSRHAYAETSPKHTHFAENAFQLPAYSVAALPFRWTRRDDAKELAAKLDLGLDLEREPDLGFTTVWIQDINNQRVMLDTFFTALRPRQSLVFFYVKRTPLANDPRRVLIGVGRVTSIGPAQEHAYNGDPRGKLRSLMWERALTHSIRPDGDDGFLLPYHAVLALCEERGIDAEPFAAFAPDDAFDAFSNVTEHVGHDHAIACLQILADRLRLLQRYIPGPWDRHLRWIAVELARLWELRGPFPGIASALHALQIGYGTLLAMDLAERHAPEGRWAQDPWRLVERALAEPAAVLSPGVAAHVQRIDGQRLAALTPERRALLELLSRFRLTIEQASRFFTQKDRPGGHSDDQLLDNPYLLFEADRHRADGVAIGSIDRGMFPDESIRSAYPLPKRSRLHGDQDPRRVRALAVHVLDEAEGRGHTLFPVASVLERIGALEFEPPCRPTKDILPLLRPVLAPTLQTVEVGDGDDGWQFGERQAVGELLRKEVQLRRRPARSARAHDWRALIDAEFQELPADPEERALEEKARAEKAAALAELYAAPLSLLLGPAGTGKTRLLQILCQLPEITGDGVTLLAPTGKARVQMQAHSKALKAYTIAQFLQPERYDVKTERYHLSDAPRREAGRTLIIDEASMLTEDQLAAVLQHVEPPRRIILVGDHRQLPPIGAGRPLVDIARELAPPDIAERFPRIAAGYAELTVHRRQSASGKDEHGKLRLRDDVLLASWFTGEDPGPGADEIWVRLARGEGGPHLTVRTWQTEAELKTEMLAALVQHVEAIRDDQDEVGFGCSLGGVESKGAVYFNNHWPDGNRLGAARSCEHWQILSPVHGKGHGVDELNRFLHERFRRSALQLSQRRGSRTPLPAGAQRIIYGDKVICTGNERRGMLSQSMGQVSNGEIGIVVGQAKFGARWDGKTPERIDVEFGTQLGTTFKYWKSDFGDDGRVVLELAYALTIHKSQGSQFGVTFVVIPQPCFILGRELLYTALTRQQDRVVLLVQGQPSDLRAYSGPRHSEVARRYTNLFRRPDMLDDGEGRFLEKGLIHRTDRGELVRSISEVVVANALHAEKIDYAYERPLRGADGAERYPDFTVVDRITDQTVFWEHLGMLSNPSYAERWRRKREWYAQLDLSPNGPENSLGQRLVTSENRLDGAIDSAAIRARVREVFTGGGS